MKTTGRAPAVVPSKPSGATPTIWNDLPFRMIDLPTAPVA